MPIDSLILGPVVFDDFSVPSEMPFGGRQKLTVHRMPGGGRRIDAMGPDDIDRIWTGTLWGDNALSDALTLDALRRSGEVLPYSNGIESRQVVILEFLPQMKKFQQIEYSIICVCADESGGGLGIGGALVGLGITGLDGMVAADLTAALEMLG